MSLRSLTDHENCGISSAGFSPSTCHSRARGNPGWLSAELAWIPTIAGMTESRWPNRSEVIPARVFSKEDTKITKFGVLKI